ncbi:hypothetical protein PI23P_04582 [Polaribacter irgensii 23-P]|uniref:Uncharacterized protein n=1 Tax=Polaribacter irgensii 23-P TaxID=313594 RepID=A4BXQ3_9FLAO|nr:hypothetical protein [Polaribacter irgensii]EAR13744.1 hypothetical protein PI23P_04582 [Polaribacter irgensii 23-P]
MKKLLFLLSFSILFQSCYSYKSIDYSTIEIDKKLQLEVLRLNKTSMKGRLVSKNEKTIILQTKNGQGTIPMEEVYNIKVREFSLLKTGGLIVGIPIGALVLLSIVLAIVL